MDTKSGHGEFTENNAAVLVNMENVWSQHTSCSAFVVFPKAQGSGKIMKGFEESQLRKWIK